jgi:hypothetical protein
MICPRGSEVSAHRSVVPPPAADGERTDILGEFLAGEPGARRTPVLESKFHIALARPIRHDVYDPSQVKLRIDLVQFARGEEREEIGAGLRVVVRSAEKPRLS